MQRRLALLLIVIAAAILGCVSDKPAVFEKQKLDKKAMKPYFGSYAVKKWPSESGPKHAKIYEKDNKIYFELDDRNEPWQFHVSKIPNSKTGLHLIAIPKQREAKAHLFFVAQAKKDRISFWVLLDLQDVVKGKLARHSGLFKAAELKAFLEKHADEYAKANKAEAVFVREKKTG